MLSRIRIYPQFSRCFATSTTLTQGALNAKETKIHKTTTPKPLVPLENLVFGHTFTDHMFMAEWESERGWHSPRIMPYQNLSLDPSCSVFHYAFEAFEGMKAYRDEAGNLRLFRPDMNLKRLNRSARRICLPVVKEEELLECLKKLVLLDERWVPAQPGYSLYLRPVIMGTQATLGVAPPNKALLYIICSPVGPYYRTGFNAVRLWAETKACRAWPGGAGNNKLGGNYAPSVLPQLEAAKLGYQQVLWLFNDHLTEVGTMNCFVYWKRASDSVPELVTPPLDDGTILPGVIRDSVLELARSWGEFQVSERAISMNEVRSAINEGRLLEMFGTGTACVVSPIKEIRYGELDLKIPLDPTDANSQAGPLARRLKHELEDIQYGKVAVKDWSVILK